MAKGFEAARDQLYSIVEALTPTSRTRTKFRKLRQDQPIEKAVKTSAGHRKFRITDQGLRSPALGLGADSVRVNHHRGLLEMVFFWGADKRGYADDMHEDLRQIQMTVQNPDNYGRATTGLIRCIVVEQTYEKSPEEDWNIARLGLEMDIYCTT